MFDQVAYNRNWRKEHKEHLRKYNKERYAKKYMHDEKHQHKQKMNTLKRLYDLTEEQYNQRLIHQNNRCAICKEEFINGKVCVDHNHETNEVRGLLCDNCNTMLGKAHDRLTILFNAIQYLEGQ